MTPSPIRVLLVDDQDLVRDGFRMILESEPGITVVGEATDGTAAISAARALNPDVICMDVQMPGADGLTATRAIVADPGIRSAVLMLTTFNRADYLFEALQAGASGFLLKNSTPESLIEAVQVLAGGEAILSPDVTRRVIEACVGVTATETPALQSPAVLPVACDDLTDREAEVFALLAQGLANAEIARVLFVGDATVKTHVSKVLQKLGLRDRVQAVVYAYDHGLALPRATDVPGGPRA